MTTNYEGRSRPDNRSAMLSVNRQDMGQHASGPWVTPTCWTIDERLRQRCAQSIDPKASTMLCERLSKTHSATDAATVIRSMS